LAALLAGVDAITVSLVLVAAFAAHLGRPGALPRALRAHRTLPGRLVRPVAFGVAAAEGVLGVAAGIALLFGAAAPLRTAMGAAAGLFSIYAMYGWHVLRAWARSRAAVSCGCAGAGHTPMSGWVVARASTLAAAGAGAWAGAGEAVAGLSSAGALPAITVIAGACFAILLWLLPSALYDPADPRNTHGRRIAAAGPADAMQATQLTEMADAPDTAGPTATTDQVGASRTTDAEMGANAAW
jgi:hypothetical protein